ncbi:hypothetical protein BUALT_Bualt16G0122000 [Buddleja alternifolia]|uniref:HMA domain-containing protein n=1 Tax=Buddleja alternifolia TaxID=168488 RepID=A0AAV6WBQ3_9LAMI|nr:hypothetical protein BUALT_Bualt16G0122000 [Buddleja alternifolia]
MQTKILSMKISCCERCPKKLKKKLLKMPGVESVTIDTERNLVLVSGTIDAMTLVNNVAKLGKAVELLPNDKHPKYNNSHFEEKHKGTSNQGYHQCPHEEENNTTSRRKGKEMHKNCCCQDGRHNHKKEVEEEHKCEAYVPPKVDERICRDYYCKVHPKMRKIVDRVPADSSSSLLGGFPFYNGIGGGGNPFGGLYYPGWYGEEPARFGYHQQPRRLPRHPFGFQ